MDSSISTAVVPIDRCCADSEELALAGSLAGYRGSTRDAYALDLRQFAVWCANHKRRFFEVNRVDIECFGRELEARGRARATIARRLCTIAGFYRYAEEEGLIQHSPATHVHRPRLDYESHATGLDRNELGALLVAAGLSAGRDHALVSLLALNGLRVSEALGADIDALGLERGHRTLTVTRKGGKVVTMPLAPRVARALDLAIGDRLEGPIFVDGAGQRLDRHAAGRIVRRVSRHTGITKRVGPHTLRLAGESTFDVRDFGMEPPRIPMLRVEPDVKVRVEIFAEKSHRRFDLEGTPSPFRRDPSALTMVEGEQNERARRVSGPHRPQRRPRRRKGPGRLPP
jgi:integrase/recombinase XerD